MPVLPRTSFNSSQLVRALASLSIDDVVRSRQTFAERLSQWLGWADAILLSGVLGGGEPGRASEVAAAAPLRARAVIEDFKRVRADLARSITTDAAFTSIEGGVGVPAFRRQYLAHQRAMEARIGPLRAKVRTALSGQSPALARLAALDAALDAALGVRERHLLSTVPGWLEKQFERSRNVPGETPATLQEPAAQGQHVQSVLLAELDIRLQPIEGMIEAMGEDTPTQASTRPTSPP